MFPQDLPALIRCLQSGVTSLPVYFYGFAS